MTWAPTWEFRFLINISAPHLQFLPNDGGGQLYIECLILYVYVCGVFEYHRSYNIFPRIYKPVLIQRSFQSFLAQKLHYYIAEFFRVVTLHPLSPFFQNVSVGYFKQFIILVIIFFRILSKWSRLVSVTNIWPKLSPATSFTICSTLCASELVENIVKQYYRRGTASCTFQEIELCKL